MNKAKTKEYQRLWEIKHRKRRLEYHKAYEASRGEFFKSYRSEWEMEHFKERQKWHRDYYLAHRARMLEQTRARQQQYKKMVMAELGGKCVCCGLEEMDFLTLEHIHKDGNVHRATGKHIYLDVIKAGIPKDRYTVLCMNCNFATRYNKICPHKRAKIEDLLADNRTA